MTGHRAELSIQGHCSPHRLHVLCSGRFCSPSAPPSIRGPSCVRCPFSLFLDFSGWPPIPTHLSYLGQSPHCLKPGSCCLRRTQKCPWFPQNRHPILTPPFPLMWFSYPPPCLGSGIYFLLPHLVLHSRPCSLPASPLQH